MKDFKVYQTSGMLNFLVSEASDVRKKEQTLSGDIVSFSADEQSPLKIVVDIDSTGWTGCVINATGKVLGAVEETVTGTGYYHDITNTDYSQELIDTLKRLKPETYKYKIFFDNLGLAGSRLIRINYTDGTRTDIPIWGDIETGSYIGTVTVPSDMSGKTVSNILAYFGQGFTGTATIETILFINQDEDFEDSDSYSGATYTITFPNSVGTVTDGTLTIDYDGSVTLKTGGQTYTLTSISPIETLIGDNNIWADAGPVSVTYPI